MPCTYQQIKKKKKKNTQAMTVSFQSLKGIDFTNPGYLKKKKYSHQVKTLNYQHFPL